MGSFVAKTDRDALPTKLNALDVTCFPYRMEVSAVNLEQNVALFRVVCFGNGLTHLATVAARFILFNSSLASQK